MNQDKTNPIGEHFSVAEELSNIIPELEQKCQAIKKSVKKRYFPLPEALNNHIVSEMEYKSWIHLHNTP